MAFPAGIVADGYAARRVRHGAAAVAASAAAVIALAGMAKVTYLPAPWQSVPSTAAGEHPRSSRCNFSRRFSSCGGSFRRDADGGSAHLFSRFALDLLSSPNGEEGDFGSLIGVSAVEIVIDAVLWLIADDSHPAESAVIA
ncbi:MAG: hypothetical protein ACLS7Z_11825 [Christensenellales bacterium]